MGFFGDFTWSDGSWGQELAEPYLVVRIEDSDIGAVEFAPATDGANGRCYLGFEPRHYYEDPSASEPVDIAAEAAGLATWAESATGAKVNASHIQRLLASPEGNEPEEAFVEVTVGKLLAVLGLPSPPESGI